MSNDIDLSAEAGSAGPIHDHAVVLDPPKRPDVTPAQIVGGIPILAELFHSFGVFDLSAAQQASLSKTVTWAIALVGGDALIRVGRNLAHRL